MRFVYQTKLGGTIELPIIKSYTRFCIIIALLTKGKNLLKGEFIENDFKDMLQAVKSLGAKLYKRENGVVIDAPSDNISPFESLFEEEIKHLKEVYGENVFSTDKILVKDEESVSKIFCLILGNIVYENKCNVELPQPIYSYKDLDIAIASITSFGGEVEIVNNKTIAIYKKSFGSDFEIEPTADMKLGSFAILCSCLFDEVKIKNYYVDSSISGFYDLILPLSEFGMVLRRDENDDVYFEHKEESSIVKVDCEKAGKYLPYLIFLAATLDKDTEFFNCSTECVNRDNGSLYYTISELNKLGANIKPFRRSTFIVHGGKMFNGGLNIDCHENLTLFFISILATLYSEKANSIENFECSNKYVGFWNLFTTLGGFTEEI